MNSQHEYLPLPILTRRTKARIKTQVLNGILHNSETRTRKSGRTRWMNAWANASRPMIGYRWHECVSKRRLLRESESIPITCIDRERQLTWTRTCVLHATQKTTRFTRLLLGRGKHEWRRPKGRPLKLGTSCHEVFKIGENSINQCVAGRMSYILPSPCVGA